MQCGGSISDTCDKSIAEESNFLAEVAWRFLIARANVSSFIAEGATLCDISKIHVRQICSTLFSRSSRRSLTPSYVVGGSICFAAPS
jgi:hypothetical protein